MHLSDSSGMLHDTAAGGSNMHLSLGLTDTHIVMASWGSGSTNTCAADILLCHPCGIQPTKKDVSSAGWLTHASQLAYPPTLQEYRTNHMSTQQQAAYNF